MIAGDDVLVLFYPLPSWKTLANFLFGRDRGGHGRSVSALFPRARFVRKNVLFSQSGEADSFLLHVTQLGLDMPGILTLALCRFAEFDPNFSSSGADLRRARAVKIVTLPHV